MCLELTKSLSDSAMGRERVGAREGGKIKKN